jgi:hypothetical protein
MDNMADHLLGWKASILNRGGRVELVKTTLLVISIFSMMALDITMETLLAIDKILEVSSGRDGRMFMEDIVSWLGTRCACPKS